MCNTNEESLAKIYDNTDDFWIFDHFLSVINQCSRQVCIYIQKSVYVCINMYLVYIILTPISSDKENAKVPPKLNQNLLTH